MKKNIKKKLDTVGRAFGKYISLLLSCNLFFTAYNYIFERVSHRIVCILVRYVNLPDKQNIWHIKLLNSHRVKSKIYKDNPKTAQFALSYKWHSPSLNFTEYLLNRYYNTEVPWIDVGSNLGLRSMLALSEGKTVFFIEPNSELNKLNLERCEINNFKNYTVFELGASEKEGVVSFYIDESSYNSSINESIKENNKIQKIENIKIDTLDNLFSDKVNSYKTACIKIDVEGHELEVINGALRLISKWLPTMIIEVNKTSNNFNNFREIMLQLDYDIYQIYSFKNNKFFKKVEPIKPIIETEIISNDFLVINDNKLKKLIDTYTI